MQLKLNAGKPKQTWGDYFWLPQPKDKHLSLASLLRFTPDIYNVYAAAEEESHMCDKNSTTEQQLAYSLGKSNNTKNTRHRGLNNVLDD